ncbi:heme exporter protein CcmD [Candidatus Thioglobus sp.]|jgi:heme exporter protein D|uniref:heme exporter protein CcmD n=1 Tax=Candidatus Thioglobus sp. TaxID=2026721 RepID=UPI001DC0407A|nr:heme exporter protein CcmD [Candidatus Thioglobus sp.]MBT3276708.1 heme exporter protein CcmD [Candidatus Thioglobus sp.]MBT3447278.1 heme exporter protein CcmD [Candidatus Thioglobus sp.]MBT3744748.1 heme exporter protein CcmD [Candidatus Thioglobus sp.]MBT4181350.1 heme exporter protein CcmD [Candidatus Thioglobus sp.]MBT5164552.1 heme exporter protein CcmD [Candidatus Thioglobus sp.]
MTLAEYFSFLPYGKYAFYIWFSYLVTLIVIGGLFLRTKTIHNSTIKQLRIKYSRS